MTIAPDLIERAATRAAVHHDVRTGFPRSILLAADASPAACAAMRVCAALAHHRGVPVEVLRVVPPVPMTFPVLADGVMARVDDTDPGAELGVGALHIRRQMDAMDTDLAWSVDVRHGYPAVVIAREARRRAAHLVVMGLRRHGRLDRLLGDETTLRVVRSCQSRVLAVTPQLTTLPRRVIVAVDFSRASLRAARAVLNIAAPDATLVLAHVRPNFDFSSERSEGARVLYSQGVAGGFARLRTEIDAPDGVTIEVALLDGAPANELLALAGRADADLIAIGSHYHNFVDRVMLGSVTTDLLRDARISLLITPPPPPGLR